MFTGWPELGYVTRINSLAPPSEQKKEGKHHWHARSKIKNVTHRRGFVNLKLRSTGQVQRAMLSAAISSVSSDLSGAAGSDLPGADHLLPSHLARAQEAYNRVSEHLSNIKSSRAKAAKGMTPSPAPDVPRDLGVAQLESAMEELLAGRRSMQESRPAHLALRSQITAELQSSKLALWEPQVPSILAASGISMRNEALDTPEPGPAEEPPLRAAQADLLGSLLVENSFVCP